MMKKLLIYGGRPDLPPYLTKFFHLKWVQHSGSRIASAAKVNKADAILLWHTSASVIPNKFKGVPTASARTRPEAAMAVEDLGVFDMVEKEGIPLLWLELAAHPQHGAAREERATKRAAREKREEQQAPTNGRRVVLAARGTVKAACIEIVGRKDIAPPYLELARELLPEFRRLGVPSKVESIASALSNYARRWQRETFPDLKPKEVIEVERAVEENKGLLADVEVALELLQDALHRLSDKLATDTACMQDTASLQARVAQLEAEAKVDREKAAKYDAMMNAAGVS
jgi:hypothetical protein